MLARRVEGGSYGPLGRLTDRGLVAAHVNTDGALRKTVVSEPVLVVKLVRGVEGAGAELKAPIPWLRVFVEGVVIVGKLEK